MKSPKKISFYAKKRNIGRLVRVRNSSSSVHIVLDDRDNIIYSGESLVMTFTTTRS